MSYCAVFGCNSNSKRDKGISFFSFPKDNRRKTWVHYCKRLNFEPTKHSKICSKHFSDNQIARNPVKMQEYGYEGAQIRLKNDAIPDIRFDVQEKDAAKPRVAYAKRRKLEILETAMGESSNLDHESNTETFEPEIETFGLATSSYAPASCSTDTNDLIQTENQKTQTEKMTKMKTRRIQAKTISVREIGIQCELVVPLDCTRNEYISQVNDDFTPQMSSTFVCDGEPDEELNMAVHSSPSEDQDDPDLDPDFDPSSDFLESSSEEDETMQDEIENYKLEKTDNPVNENYYLVSESSLTDILSFCRRCGKECTSFIEYTKGTLISTSSVCADGHVTKWNSQAMHNKLPWGNLLTASAIVFSGCNTAKVLRMFSHMKVQMINQRTAARLQSSYTVPATIEEFDDKQASLLQTLRGKEVVLGGDGRCDSPGYSAKFGCYTLMDLDSCKIVDVRLIQSNEVKGSTHMELEGLRRGLDYLTRVGNRVNVTAMVTDRHVMIKKYMRENYPNIKHYFDVWHIAKGVSKKLEVAAKKRGAGNIRPWIRSISNHTYWVAATGGDDGDEKLAKWTSITNHIRDIHRHESELFPQCEHGQLEEDLDREWLQDGSRSFKLVKDVVESPYLLRDIPKLSPVHQTYGLEVYHSVLNQFAPKSTHFFYASMMARTYVAALHFNENGNRQQAETRDGEGRWRKSFPKAKKGEHCVVKAQRVPATFDYVHDLMTRVFRRRHMYDSIAAAAEDFRLGFDKPDPLTSLYQNVDKDFLIRERQSRFVN